jgi:hypothetical protein
MNGMMEGNLPVIPKSSLVRKDKLAETHERVKTCEKNGDKKKIVMRRGRGNTVKGTLKVSMGKR